MWQTISWQANDPLVHYHLDDLWAAGDSNLQYVVTIPYKQVLDPWLSANLGHLNVRYKPWGRETFSQPDYVDPNDIEISVKDPWMLSSDYWQFPITAFPLVKELGQIHRGTPWQTLYLKSKVAPMAGWARQTGAAFTPQTHPTNDWKLVSILAALFNTNAPDSQLWINETNEAAWHGVLDGTFVLANEQDQIGNLICMEYLMLSNSPQASNLVAGIAEQRSAFPNAQFPTLGDVLSTPALSCASPWISWNDPSFLFFECLDDTAYEAIPAHILPLLKAGPRLSMMSEGGFSITGANGQAVVLEGSVDLKTWEPLATNIVDVIFFYADPAPASPCRFYRARLVP
jgi:hypothetical protein